MKKEEIEKMNRVRTLELLNSKDKRIELREVIMQRLNKHDADTRFVREWARAIQVRKVLISFLKAVK